MTETTETETTETGACACGGCGCGANEEQSSPMAVRPGDLDVRDIPQEVRQDRVIGQVTSLVPGETLVLAAPHDPQRLLDQLEAEITGQLEFEPLREGPEVWRVAITRVTCC